MADLNLLKARKKAIKTPSPPFIPLLTGLLKLTMTIFLAILLLYGSTLLVHFLLQKTVAASEKAPLKELSSGNTKKSSNQTILFGTDSETASLAAAIPLLENATLENNQSANPSDLLVQITDEINKITVYRLESVLSAYWADTQHFPVSQANNSHAWIQQMVDIGDMNPIYATYLYKISGDTALCNTLEQNGLCYISDGQQAVVSIPLVSPQEKALCKNTLTLFIWTSTGKIGIACR